jgi:hypothetical protein
MDRGNSNRIGAAMATDARAQLVQAIKAHTAELKIERSLAAIWDVEVLDLRIEATQLLLEWLSKALEPERAASKHQTPPPRGLRVAPKKSPPPETDES